MVDAVMAHVYGLGELDELWATEDVENIDVNGHDRGVRHLRRRRQAAMVADRRATTTS